MAELMRLRIGEKALIISFLRTKLGKEFDVADRLSKRFTINHYPSYNTCFGHHDLIEFSMVASYKEAMYNLPCDKVIIDYELQLFHSWDDISRHTSEFFKGFPVLVLALFKIHPNLEEKLLFNIETNVINYIKKTFLEDVNLFAGMGRSEILLLLRGRNLEKLLSIVSELRQDLVLEKISQGLDIAPFDSKTPVFIDSTTFPLISHPALLNRTEFGKFEGQVLPSVYAVCNPGYEKFVSKNKPPSCTTICNVYGNHDVILIWEKKIHLSQFVEEHTEFRRVIGQGEGVKNTVTSFIGIKLEAPQNSSLPPQEGTIISPLVPGTEEIISQSEIMDPMVRAQLLEFLGRLNSYYGQQEFKSSVRDMRGFRHLIFGPLKDLASASQSLKHSLNTHLSEVIDLSNNALYQRYAGLETHFETCKHLPFPFLRGINSYISAASCIPYHIFKAVFPDEPVQESWAGFAIFGLTYSYQLLRGNILSFPALFLHRPIEDWWGITHEVAHAIYWLSDFYDEDLPDDIRQYFEEIPVDDKDLYFMLKVDIEEIYSNWFDFKYIFEGNQCRYFPMIWKSWLRWERVRKSKEEYLLRSLIVFLIADLAGLHYSIHMESVSHTEKYMESKFDELKKIITAKVPEFAGFISDVTPQWITGTAGKFARRIEHYLNFLENKYFERDIYEQINPPYPEKLVEKHVERLKDGLIVSDNIPNPIKLLHSLYDIYPAEPPLRTTAAVVLTFWSKFIREYGD